jgi:hypothetical protein
MKEHVREKGSSTIAVSQDRLPSSFIITLISNRFSNEMLAQLLSEKSWQFLYAPFLLKVSLEIKICYYIRI